MFDVTTGHFSKSWRERREGNADCTSNLRIFDNKDGMDGGVLLKIQNKEDREIIRTESHHTLVYD